jgi:hypothetical protein
MRARRPVARPLRWGRIAMKKTIKKLSLRTQTITRLTDVAGVAGGVNNTWRTITIDTGPVLSREITCKGCPPPSMYVCV